MKFAIFIVVFFVLNLLHTYWRHVEKYGSHVVAERRWYGAAWHIAEQLIWSWVAVWGLIEIYDAPDWPAWLGVLAAIWWILFDGLFNVMRGISFWWVSTTTTDWLRRFGKREKIIFALLMILLYLYLRGQL